MKNKNFLCRSYVFIIIGIFSFSFCFAQTNTFKSIMRYDIKGIAVNGQLICPINGFTHGTIDYGIYKQRGYYFAVTHDNAALGNNMMLIEVIDYENFNDNRGMGKKCTMIQMGYPESGIFKGQFWEKEEVVYFTFSSKLTGKEVTMLYIMLPQTSNNKL